MTSTVLVSRVCVSAGPRKLSIQSRRGVPRPAAAPARGRLHRGNALVAGRSRALTPSQPLGRRFRYSPRAAPRCRAQVRVGRLPPGAFAPPGRRSSSPGTCFLGLRRVPGTRLRLEVQFTIFPCRQALVSTRLNFSSSRTRIASFLFLRAL